MSELRLATLFLLIAVFSLQCRPGVNEGDHPNADEEVEEVVCDSGALERAVAGLGELPPGDGSAVLTLATACDAPDWMRSLVEEVSDASPEDRQRLVSMAISRNRAAWSDGCAGGIDVFESMATMGWLERSVGVWDSCELTRWGHAESSEIAEMAPFEALMIYVMMGEGLARIEDARALEAVRVLVRHSFVESWPSLRLPMAALEHSGTPLTFGEFTLGAETAAPTETGTVYVEGIPGTLRARCDEGAVCRVRSIEFEVDPTFGCHSLEFALERIPEAASTMWIGYDDHRMWAFDAPSARVVLRDYFSRDGADERCTLTITSTVRGLSPL